jgi:hypothetical protein
MGEIGWMRTGPRSGITVVADPDGAPREIARSFDRLDAAFAAVTDPERPGWYRAVSKLGYAWYLVIAAITFSIAFATSSGALLALVYAVIAAAVLGPVTAGLLGVVARKQATVDGAAEVARSTVAAERHVVRIAQVGVVEAVRDVLMADPAQDGHVRRLAWRISATDDLRSDPGADAAAGELFALQDRLRPDDD